MSAQTSAEFEGGGFTPPDVPSEAIANTCIKCGLCLPTCPTYQLTLDERSSPRGRIFLIQSVLEGRLSADDPTFTAQMSECLGCRNCEPVCPSGVAFGSLLEDARAQIARRNAFVPRSIAARLAYDFALGDVRRLRAIAALISIAEASGVRALLRASGLLELLGLARLDALLQAPRGRPFVARGQSWPSGGDSPRGTAALFTGCIMSAMFGDVHRSTVHVLARSGWRVEAPAGQGCCGALHLHAGFKDAARDLARDTIEAFETCKAEKIAVNAAGCGAAMKEYGALLADDPLWAHRAARFSERVCDATELVDAVQLSRSRSSDESVRVTYQDACHLAHAQGVRSQPRSLIDAIPGVERVEMAQADRCCGSAGVYNVTHPEMADRLAEMKISAARDVAAQRIITANPGCQMQLTAASLRAGGPPISHIMEFLDEPFIEPTPNDELHSTTKGLMLAAGAIVFAGIAFYLLCRKR
jgi:glycolate dehydrogenase iron-sulfur subunit